MKPFNSSFSITPLPSWAGAKSGVYYCHSWGCLFFVFEVIVVVVERKEGRFVFGGVCRGLEVR